MEIAIDGKCVGTLTFTLFSDYVPRTCENFMGYIKGEDESGNKLVDPDGLPQHYLGGEFRRVIPGWRKNIQETFYISFKIHQISIFLRSRIILKMFVLGFMAQGVLPYGSKLKRADG